MHDIYVPACTPKEFGTVNFHFVKAKVGVEGFWVKRIEHDISSEASVTIRLDGHTLNKYCEYAIQKVVISRALAFYGRF